MKCRCQNSHVPGTDWCFENQDLICNNGAPYGGELASAGVPNCLLIVFGLQKHPTTFPYLKVQRNITLGEKGGLRNKFKITMRSKSLSFHVLNHLI